MLVLDLLCLALALSNDYGVSLVDEMGRNHLECVEVIVVLVAADTGNWIIPILISLITVRLRVKFNYVPAALSNLRQLQLGVVHLRDLLEVAQILHLLDDVELLSQALLADREPLGHAAGVGRAEAAAAA